MSSINNNVDSAIVIGTNDDNHIINYESGENSTIYAGNGDDIIDNYAKLAVIFGESGNNIIGNFTTTENGRGDNVTIISGTLPEMEMIRFPVMIVL